MMGNLFNKYYLNEFTDSYRKKLINDIDGLEITASTNIEELAEKLKQGALIHPIDIKEPKPSEPKETTRQRQSDFGETYNQKVYKIHNYRRS